MIHFFAAAALLLASQPGFSQAPIGKPCLDRAEVADVAVFVLPGAIEGFARKCAPALPANAFLKTGAGALSARLKAEADNRWPSVKRVFERLNGEPLPSFLGDDAVRKIAREAAATAIVGQVDRKDCGAVDDAVAALAPLPAANLGRIATLLLELGDKESEARLPFRMCPVASS